MSRPGSSVNEESPRPCPDMRVPPDTGVPDGTRKEPERDRA